MRGAVVLSDASELLVMIFSGARVSTSDSGGVMRVLEPTHTHASVAGAAGWRVSPGGVAKLALAEVSPVRRCASPPGGPSWLFFGILRVGLSSQVQLRGASHERKEGGRQEHLLKMIGSGG